MAGGVDDYMEKAEQLGKLSREIRKQCVAIEEIALALRNDGWKRIVTTNAGHGFPAHLMRAPAIDANSWPSIKALGEVMSQWHDARLAVQNAYASLPQNAKAVVKAPTDFE